MIKCKFKYIDDKESLAESWIQNENWILSLKKDDTITLNDQHYQIVSRHFNIDSKQLQFNLKDEEF